MSTPMPQSYYDGDASNSIVECASCVEWMRRDSNSHRHFAMTFMDPPFNQGKEYRSHDDAMSDTDYWEFMGEVCAETIERTLDGGCIYFMQREKNVENVLKTLRVTGWTFQNLIIWKKLTSAVPGSKRFGKAFQVIALATKGPRPLTFNKLRISPRLPAGYKPHANGIFVTDIWDDIRELTSGYFAGDEAIRNADGERSHKQQSPIALLLRCILSSTLPGMCVFDPFAGSGTTSVVARQLHRDSVSLEIDPDNHKLIKDRLIAARSSDDIRRFHRAYCHTKDLYTIWPSHHESDSDDSMKVEDLNEESKPTEIRI